MKINGIEISPDDIFVFLDDAGRPHKSCLFINPLKIIQTADPAQVEPSLNEIDAYLDQGYYAAGYLAFEAYAAFQKYPVLPYSFPIVYFGIFTAPATGNRLTIDASFPPRISPLRLNVDAEAYCQDIQTIKSYIKEGESYQVNYTAKGHFTVSGAMPDLYQILRHKQPVPYGAWLNCGSHQIMSFSPELFFKKEGCTLTTRPMKGTWQRGRYTAEDHLFRTLLANDPKNRSENVMIVDLLRNDMGRLSQLNTVKVERLFEVERHDTLFQMTSTITSQLSTPDVSLYHLFESLFPSGSITGAPKCRTIEIIREVEKAPRKVYTGCIGFISPNRDMTFNVAIRTLEIDPRSGHGEIGIGGGILYDSDPADEYSEALLKARFLTVPWVTFDVIETILWDNGYPYLAYHMNRLVNSLDYFGFKYDTPAILKHLTAIRFETPQPHRVRLSVSRNGKISTSISKWHKKFLDPPRITMAQRHTCSADRFLFHKTTNRLLYDTVHAQAQKAGYFDTVFLNERGEVTEGAISNIFVEVGGQLYTPPLTCGLLPGTARERLIRDRSVQEKVLYEADLRHAHRLYCTNAIVGVIEVTLDDSKHAPKHLLSNPHKSHFTPPS